MKILRTACCGVLIEFDGVSVLIDGVAKGIGPYRGTSEGLRKEFMENPPDFLIFTHMHEDHYDRQYAEFYKNTRYSPVLTPENTCDIKKDGITIKSISTRHIGNPDFPHVSYSITGEKTIWFMGDASPSMLKVMENFPKPDILFVPFAFATTRSSWQSTLNTGALKIVVLHLPKKEEDTEGLWDKVYEIAGNDGHLIIPKIGEEILIF